MKKVLRYLKRTKKRKIIRTYCRSDVLEVVGYIDADFGGCTNYLRSTNVIYLLAGSGPTWERFR